MPSLKSGTATNDLVSAVFEFESDKLEYIIDQTGIVHVPIGNLEFEITDLNLNLKMLTMSSIRKKFR